MAEEDGWRAFSPYEAEGYLPQENLLPTDPPDRLEIVIGVMQWERGSEYMRVLSDGREGFIAYANALRLRSGLCMDSSSGLLLT